MAKLGSMLKFSIKKLYVKLRGNYQEVSCSRDRFLGWGIVDHSSCPMCGVKKKV
ncbi:hypothetical protein H5410_046041 [Solanum commersonii]|uniref:Uncharacterized protein n=1 Tax=Solanum commersonii TaxID=4109 RepID=A0A9J5XDC8_SOLCO|nr:hypothetical protein H5410_046041 [Solanum commersonii]